MNEKYGLQFLAFSAVPVPPDTSKRLIRYLSSSKFAGIGEKTAEAIVAQFGTETMPVLKNTPEKLLCIRGITLKKMESIRQSIGEMESYGNLAVFLGQYEVRQDRIASAILYVLKNDSIEANSRQSADNISITYIIMP